MIRNLKIEHRIARDNLGESDGDLISEICENVGVIANVVWDRM